MLDINNNELLKFVGFQRDEPQGCCVLSENFLISAGHCIPLTRDTITFEFSEEYNPGFKEIKVSKSQQIFRKSDFTEVDNENGKSTYKNKEDKEKFDLCIFDISPVSSPLKISTKSLKTGEVLTSVSWFEILKDKTDINQEARISSKNIFEQKINIMSANTNSYIPLITKAVVLNNNMFNFFLVKTEKQLTEGSSGSPIFNGKGELVGILSGSFQQTEDNSLDVNNILYQNIVNIQAIIKQN